MQIESLAQLGDTYDHVYISPHLDDTVISCGGAVAAQLAAGERVLSVTLSTAAPDPAGPFSALADEFHSQWKLSAAQAVSARLAEERAAMARMPGLDHWWAGRLDAIYRFPEAYNTRESLFSAPDPRDPQFAGLGALFSELRERMPGAQFYGPLGVGSHVDHLIAHAMLRQVFGAGARFYEDLPYSITPSAYEARMAQLAGEQLSAHAVAIDATLGQKIAAIQAYASQLYELFGGAAQMEQQMTDYAARVAPAGARYGERVWRIG